MSRENILTESTGITAKTMRGNGDQTAYWSTLGIASRCFEWPHYALET